MIRPASEIEYPPSVVSSTKAKMIARLEKMADSTSTLVESIARRFETIDHSYFAEIEAFTKEQKLLVENMKRMVRS